MVYRTKFYVSFCAEEARLLDKLMAEEVRDARNVIMWLMYEEFRRRGWIGPTDGYKELIEKYIAQP